MAPKTRKEKPHRRGGFKEFLDSPEPRRKRRFQPTDEQVEALDLFGRGESMAIQAGAGTGKTSTTLLIADDAVGRRGQYAAFNKAIVTEAAGKFPSHVACNTAHSLAFRAVGRHYSHRLNGKRMRSSELAYRMGLSSFQVNLGGSPKTLTPAYLASLVMRSVNRFCQTADPHPKAKHIPYVDGIDVAQEDGKRGWENNDYLRELLIDHVWGAWEDIQKVDGQLPFSHSCYLKIWQLSEPKIDADFILFDEVQDADPVMADVVLKQTHAQIVLVGDSQQEIYGWRGAVNAFELFDMKHTTYLTQSFRFGDAIAEVANSILAGLDTPLRLRGSPQLASRVGAVPLPDAILTRTNANAVRSVLAMQAAGQPVCLVGGGSEILAFARAANDLIMRGHTMHPELACFDSWSEVREYVEQDPQGSDLKLNFELVEEFGIDVIEAALSRMPKEGDGVVTVSTAHKAKGREWPKVQLSFDFAPKEGKKAGGDTPPSPEEQRLLYVAVIRAREELDVTMVPQLNK